MSNTIIKSPKLTKTPSVNKNGIRKKTNNDVEKGGKKNTIIPKTTTKTQNENHENNDTSEKTKKRKRISGSGSLVKRSAVNRLLKLYIQKTLDRHYGGNFKGKVQVERECGDFLAKLCDNVVASVLDMGHTFTVHSRRITTSKYDLGASIKVLTSTRKYGSLLDEPVCA